MKHSFTLLLTLGTISVLTAQTPLGPSIDAGFGAGQTYRLLKAAPGSQTGELLRRRNDRETPRTSFRFFVQYNYPLGSHWTWRTGLAISDYGYNGLMSTPYWGPRSIICFIEDPPLTSQQITSRFRYLEMPQSLRYERWPSRLGLFVEGGVRPAWMVVSDAWALHPDEFWFGELTPNHFRVPRRFLVFGQVSCGVQYRATPHWVVFAQPGATIALNSMIGGQNYREYLAGWSIDLGVRYAMQKI